MTMTKALVMEFTIVVKPHVNVTETDITDGERLWSSL